MSLTLKELQERLAESFDPDVLLEFLDISSADLVEAFSDRIADRFDRLEKEVIDDDNDSSE